MAYRLSEARSALAVLSADPDDTEQAIRAIGAMAGNSGERLFRRFRRSTSGAKILQEKRELYDMLSDINLFGSMPEGSLGHEIWFFYTTELISAQGLKQASESAADNKSDASTSDRALFGRRSRESRSGCWSCAVVRG